MKFFTVAYHGDGKRQRKVFRNLSGAKEAAREIATKIAQGRANARELNGSDLESYNAAMNLLRPHGLPLHAVVEEYLAARERLAGESLLSAAKEYARRHSHSDKPAETGRRRIARNEKTRRPESPLRVCGHMVRQVWICDARAFALLALGAHAVDRAVASTSRTTSLRYIYESQEGRIMLILWKVTQGRPPG